MRLRTYTEVSGKQLPKIPDSFEYAKEFLTGVFEKALHDSVVKYVFYGSAVRGDLTVSSDLDALTIITGYDSLIAERIRITADDIYSQVFVPVDIEIVDFELLPTKFHILSPDFIEGLRGCIEDEFPDYEKCITLEEEVRMFTASRYYELSCNICDPKFFKPPLSENENFLRLVGKSCDDFAIQARKIICIFKGISILENNNILSVFEKYTQIIPREQKEQVELFEKSRKFRQDYEELILSNPSKDIHEDFLERRGMEVIRSSLQFIKGNMPIVDDAYKL